MIIAFVGTPGSGKSYDAVQKILDNIKLGRRVYTNIDGLNKPECRRYIADYCNITDYQLETCLNFLTEEQASNFWLHCEVESLIIIDEIHLLFSNRNWQTKENTDLAKWASTHRHNGYDCVFITQDLEKVEKHVRSLIEWTYHYRKLNQFGSAVTNSYKVHAFQGSSASGEPLGTVIRKYKKGVFPCYNSYDTKKIKEVAFMKHYNILKKPVILAVPIALVIFIAFFMNSSFSKGKLIDTPVVSQAIPKEVKKETPPSTEEKKKIAEIPSNVAHSPQEKKEKEEKRDISKVIQKWQLKGGEILYTNNGIKPSNGVLIGEI